jgi:hypothetical protein
MQTAISYRRCNHDLKFLYDGEISCWLGTSMDLMERPILFPTLCTSQDSFPDYLLMETRMEFYEDLVLWSILSTAQVRRTSTKPTIWHRFLDDLCYLCDTEGGGRSVVSIGVSRRGCCQYFFISANAALRKAAEQLRLVLGQLRQIEDKSDIDLEIAKEKLLDIVVRRSSMKVRNYIRELRLHLRDAEHLDAIRESE